MKKALILSSLLTFGLLGANLASADTSTYTVQDNDTFWTISQKLNLNLNQLLAANPTVDPNLLHGGMVIHLPAITSTNTTGTATTTSSATVSSPGSSTQPATGTSTASNTPAKYTVQSGDNFWSISQKLNVSWNSLIAANPNVSPSNLTIGMTLNVPSSSAAVVPNSSSSTAAGSTPSTSTSSSNASNTTAPSLTNSTSAANTSNTYKIQAGDNFWSISQKFNVSWNSLIAANPNVNPNNLMIGQVIQLPAVVNTTTIPISTTPANTTQTSSINSTTSATPIQSSQGNSSTSATASSTTSVPSTTTSDQAVKPAWQVKADAIIASGMKFLGTPYVFGGSDPSTGFDCSGFTQYVFGLNGISLPHSSAMQSQMGTPVAKDQLREGDLVFLQGTYTTGVSHVGIYMGNNQVLQAGTLDNVRAVKISTFFGTPYYDSHYWGAQRLIN